MNEKRIEWAAVWMSVIALAAGASTVSADEPTKTPASAPAKSTGTLTAPHTAAPPANPIARRALNPQPLPPGPPDPDKAAVVRPAAHPATAVPPDPIKAAAPRKAIKSVPPDPVRTVKPQSERSRS